jgi:hypothetical protein
MSVTFGIDATALRLGPNRIRFTQGSRGRDNPGLEAGTALRLGAILNW